MPQTGTVNVDVAVNANVKKLRAAQTGIPTVMDGYVPDAVRPYVTQTEAGFGALRQTILTISALPLTVVNGTEYQSAQIFQFPKGRILVHGTTTYLAETTTSAIASTINSGVNMSTALGTAAASNVTLSSTMVDLDPAHNLTTSTVINVAAAAVGSALAASAHFDGTTTAKAVYLNTGFTTTTDIDADGTLTISGVVRITWTNLGAYSTT